MSDQIDIHSAGPEGYRVVVSDATSKSVHEVTLRAETLKRLNTDGVSPEAFLTRCFEFLLAREPKESILSSFDVEAIGRYFPEFEAEITKPA